MKVLETKYVPEHILIIMIVLLIIVFKLELFTPKECAFVIPVILYNYGFLLFGWKMTGSR